MTKTKIISWTAVILWMALIFVFSHQPSSTSSALSSGITEQVIEVLHSILQIIDVEKEQLHTFIRKSAHFFVYMILGILIVNALRKSGQSGVKALIFALGICVLYAISDEAHQLFIAGRSGEARDVLIDSSGAAIGMGLYLFTVKIIGRRKSS